MTRDPLVRAYLATCVIALALSGGCAFDHYDRVHVHVIDGDTGNAVPNARVDAPRGLSWTGDSHTATTDALGSTTISALGPVKASAEGYMPSLTDFRLSPPSEPKPMRSVLRVFHFPSPRAGITVPNGYRGPLFILEHVERSLLPADVPTPTLMHGQRDFPTLIDPKSVTVLIAPPRLSDAHSLATFVRFARYEDGRPLRFENPIVRSGFDGEFMAGLPFVRDEVPPITGHISLCDLGLWADRSKLRTRPSSTKPFSHETGEIYFVGTAAEANVAQQRYFLEGAAIDATQPVPAQSSFRPSPLSIDALPISR